MATLDQRIHSAMNEAVTKTVHTFVREHLGDRAHFIYNPSDHGPCHATLRLKSGPWSLHRVGFCGREPDYGPVACIDEPGGGLCRICQGYVEKVDGIWRIRQKPKFASVVYSRRSPYEHDYSVDDDD